MIVLQNVERKNVENYRMLKYKTSKIQNVENTMGSVELHIYENHLFLSTLQLTELYTVDTTVTVDLCHASLT
jgi:hypothetical protein